MTNVESIRAEYERLRPHIPTFPGEREWPDRLRDWGAFVEFGPMVAEDFYEIAAAERAGRSWAKGEFERRRAMCPALFDLVRAAFLAR